MCIGVFNKYLQDFYESFYARYQLNSIQKNYLSLQVRVNAICSNE